MGGFTLIELMVVMVIIAIVMVLAINGFGRIGRGSAPQKAAENIETTIALARQHAITRNVPVIVLFMDKDFFTRNGHCAGLGLTNSQGRIYAVFDAANRFYITGWTELPPGVVFDSAAPASASRNLLTVANDMVWNRNTGGNMIPFPSSHTNGVANTNILAQLPGLALRTDGSIYVRTGDTAGSRSVCVAEGYIDNSGNVHTNGASAYRVKVSPLGSTAREAY